jgi:plasmid stabilization system protein ParE
VKLLWSAFALADRDGIFTHIDFPESGRLGRVVGTREFVINGTPVS